MKTKIIREIVRIILIIGAFILLNICTTSATDIRIPGNYWGQLQDPQTGQLIILCGNAPDNTCVIIHYPNPEDMYIILPDQTRIKISSYFTVQDEQGNIDVYYSL